MEKFGWMCSTDFDSELGEANGGNKVFPSKENCEANLSCCHPDTGDGYCKPIRVKVTLA